MAGEEFLEQIMAVPSAYINSGGGGEGAAAAAGYGRDVESMPMVLQLRDRSLGIGAGVAMPLGLNLEPGFVTHQHHQHSSVANCRTRFGDNVIEGNDHHHQLHLNNHHHNTANNSSMSSSSSISGITKIRDSMHMRGMHTALGQLHSHAHAHSFRPTVPSHAPPQLHPHQHQPLHSLQPQNPVSVPAVPQPPGIRPRVRARRGQATDPHSIAERLRRERIAERMRALQELVPSANKTDRAAMLDEIVDYVKFLRLQVKVLSMSRLGGAGAIAQLVADVPLSTLEGEDDEGGTNKQAWDKWSNDGTEQEVAKLVEEDVGAAMQFLQSKALCIMPISLASAIFCSPQSEAPTNTHQA